jgi:hypothetical protein
VRPPRAEIVLRDLERAYISLHYIYEDFEEEAERAFRAYEILKGCYGEVEVLWRSWGGSEGDC